MAAKFLAIARTERSQAAAAFSGGFFFTQRTFFAEFYPLALKKYTLSECGRRWYPFAIAQHIGAERS